MNLPAGVYAQPGKNGLTYKVKWRDANGQQRSKTFKKLSDAKKFNTRIRADRDKGLAGPAGLNMDFSELVSKWLVAVSHHSKSTVLRRDGVLRNHLLPTFGPLKLPRITPLEIDKASAQWMEDGLSLFSIRTHLQILNQIMSYAVRMDLVAKNPVKNATRRPLPTPEVRALTQEEVSALCEAIDPHYKSFVRTAVATGFRFSELVDLTAADLAVDSLRVRQGKTENAKRTVPIYPELFEELKASLPELHPSDLPLFRTPTGARIHHSNFRTKVFIPAVNKAGLEGVTFHDLRSTRATMLVHGETDPKTTMQLMGHARIETTLVHYVNSSPSAALKAAGIAREFILGSQVA